MNYSFLSKGYFCPVWLGKTTQRKLRCLLSIKMTVQFGEQQKIKRCGKCREWMPADTEFFRYENTRVGLSSWCKFCNLEQVRLRSNYLN